MKLIELTKVCTKCGERKNWLKFQKHKGCRFGRGSECKLCRYKTNRAWARKNHEKMLAYSLKYRENNCEKVRKASLKWSRQHPEKMKAWREENPERKRELDRRWDKENPEKKKEQDRRYRKNNTEKERERKHRYRIENPERCRVLDSKRNAKRRATLKGSLNDRIGGAIYRSLRNNKGGKSWQDIVGYTLDKLKRHLEKQFISGMTWEKFLSGEIHIDHKIPIKVFNFTKPEHEDFKRCWALGNLQPMWAHDNFVKQGQIDKHFQPSLLI